jgi:hypothetical protein
MRRGKHSDRLRQTSHNDLSLVELIEAGIPFLQELFIRECPSIPQEISRKLQLVSYWTFHWTNHFEIQQSLVKFGQILLEHFVAHTLSSLGRAEWHSAV